jgi:hypothetical protein
VKRESNILCQPVAQRKARDLAPAFLRSIDLQAASTEGSACMVFIRACMVFTPPDSTEIGGKALKCNLSLIGLWKVEHGSLRV